MIHLRCRVQLRSGIYRIALLTLIIHCAGCQFAGQNKRQDPNENPQQDINAVLRHHDDALMAIPGVEGVYVGLSKDGKTPCLKVMVARKTRDILQKIPKSIEGYPVVVEKTGVIRPLDN